MKTIVVTLAMLEDKGACEEQMALFERCFGEKVVVTPELIRQHAHDFNLQWVMDNLLDHDQYEKCTAEYRVILARTCDAGIPNCCLELDKQLAEAVIRTWLE